MANNRCDDRKRTSIVFYDRRFLLVFLLSGICILYRPKVRTVQSPAQKKGFALKDGIIEIIKCGRECASTQILILLLLLMISRVYVCALGCSNFGELLIEHAISTVLFG